MCLFIVLYQCIIPEDGRVWHGYTQTPMIKSLYLKVAYIEVVMGYDQYGDRVRVRQTHTDRQTSWLPEWPHPKGCAEFKLDTLHLTWNSCHLVALFQISAC